MSEDTKLKELIINTLSPEQFEPITPSETEIYLVEDDAEYATVEELATKQDVIDDLEQIRTNANLVTTKQDIISDLSTIRSNASTGAGLAPQVAVNTQRIEDLTVAKFPNVVIVGTPHIEGGQVSNYSDTSYLQFPFVDISRGQPFDIYFSFTTGADITTQQNILDSYFGIALAIQNGKGIMALSSNGQSWDIGMATGTNTLKANTTYYVKYSWTGTQYNASLSLNDETYVPDMTLNSNLSPYKTTIFIGGSPNLFGAGTAHPFKGTINFNKSKVVVNNITVWEGMADVGLASRANVSLNNLDEVGEARFNAKQDTLVSGTNIKTVNGEDVLGEGDLKLSTYHPPLLSCMWSDHLINDIRWLRADTFSWQSGDVYKYVYDKLFEEFIKEGFVVEQDGNVGYRRTVNRFKITYQDYEQAVLDKYNSDGIAWYYIVDTENKRFKLPRTKFGFEGLRTSVGSDIAESLPNFNSTFGTSQTTFYTGGTIQKNVSYDKTTGNMYIPTSSQATTGDRAGYVTIKGSYSSSTYQDNAPVQERATQMYLYFYVGEYAQTAVEQTAGLNAELFNGKADISYVNNELAGKVNVGDGSVRNLTVLPQNNDKEGGEIYFAPASNEKTTNNISIDRNDGCFRVLGTSSTGTVRVLVNADAETGRVTLNSGNPTIIRDYLNGASGYRIWSNGYCEQWGISPYPQLSANTPATSTVTFTKTFANTNYNFQATIATDGGNSWDVTLVASSRNVGSVVTSWASRLSISSSNGRFCWVARGYLATGQY